MPNEQPMLAAERHEPNSLHPVKYNHDNYNYRNYRLNVFDGDESVMFGIPL